MPVSKKKRTTMTPEPSMSDSSTPELPEQHVFHQHLRHLAQSAVRIVIEAVMREELDAFIGAVWGERSLKRKGYRNGTYLRDLVTSTGRLEDLQVPRDREGQFHTQVFDRYSRYERATRKSFRLAVSAASPQWDLLFHQEYPTGTCGCGNATV
jgi:putative transposase